MLRAIVGLEAAEDEMLIDGVDVSALEPSDGDVSMMFQTPALLPHRHVLGT